MIDSPLVELAADGRVVAVRRCPAPDREPFTEFYGGVLLLGLDEEVALPLLAERTTPIAKLFAPHLDPMRRTLHLLTGLDYRQQCCTALTRLQRL